MQQLLQLIDELGLTIIEKREKHLAGYRPTDHTIRIAPRLPERTARSLLAHEVGHHILGHYPTEFGPVRRRQERAANMWAAGYLIDIDRYREVERLRDGHVPSMAFDLDVAPELVDAYRGMLFRSSDAVYVQARMGVGQWAHRAEAV